MAKLDFQDVLIVPKTSSINSRAEITYKRDLIGRTGIHYGKFFPIVAANMDNIGVHSVLKVFENYDAIVAVTKTIERRALLRPEWLAHKKSAMITIGLNEDYGILDELMAEYSLLCIDVANGYTDVFAQKVEEVRTRYPKAYFMAGNIATAEGAKRLYDLGVDCIKAGIGSGSACLTRQVAGVGYPQLSAVRDILSESASFAPEGIKVCSDGGCSVAGDVVKALAAGAELVMLGGMLAGYKETGEVFYGMSSEKANNRHFGGLQGYRASEGRELNINREGSVSQVLDTVRGGVTSACAYVGAHNLNELCANTRFIEVNRQLNESLARL